MNYTVARWMCLALTLVSASVIHAQILGFSGSHHLTGQVNHSILATEPPFASNVNFDQFSPVFSLGPFATEYSLIDPVFITSQVAMYSAWDASSDRVSGVLSKSGNILYDGPSGNRINPHYGSSSTVEFTVQMGSAGVPYGLNIDWNLLPITTVGDGSGHSSFIVTVGDDVLAMRYGKIAGGSIDNISPNLGLAGNHVFEGVSILDNIKVSVSLFGPGNSQGISGCENEPCGFGQFTQDSVVSYELVVGEDALPLDTDADLIPDSSDHCTQVSNPSQYDSNADGYGNLCDPDLDNNGVVNFADFAVVSTRFLSTPQSGNWLADADLNNDGAINFADIAIVSSFFLMPPGPSGAVP